MKKKIFIVAAVFISSQLAAQTSDEDSIRTLDKVVITATKYPTKQSNTGKLVSVITREQIEKSSGKDLAQVLNEQTGLTLSGSFSNPGKDKSIFFRGAKIGRASCREIVWILGGSSSLAESIYRD